jgi:hypothetical protein
LSRPARNPTRSKREGSVALSVRFFFRVFQVVDAGAGEEEEGEEGAAEEGGEEEEDFIARRWMPLGKEAGMP